MNNRKSALTFGRTNAAKVFAVIFCLIGSCTPAVSQTISNRQWSRLNLPAAMRNQLIERFELFSEYEKTESYDKQFELLGKEHMASLLHKAVDKESYVKFKQESQRAVGKLIELTVKDIKRMPNTPDWFNLSVVAKLQKGKITYSDSPICVAYRVGGTWRFSLLYVN